MSGYVYLRKCQSVKRIGIVFLPYCLKYDLGFPHPVRYVDLMGSESYIQCHQLDIKPSDTASGFFGLSRCVSYDFDIKYNSSVNCLEYYFTVINSGMQPVNIYNVCQFILSSGKKLRLYDCSVKSDKRT